MKNKIITIVEEYIRKKNNVKIKNDTKLITEGILDSSDILSILIEIENKLSINISEINIESINSINDMINEVSKFIK